MKEGSFLKAKPNTCPQCKAGEDHMDYTDTIHQDGYTTYRGKCLKCGCIFEELYEERYVHTEIVEDGKK